MNEYTFSSLKSFHSYRRLNLLRKKLDHLVSINFAHEFHERDHKYDGKGENCLLTIATCKAASWNIVCRHRKRQWAAWTTKFWKASDSKAQFIRKFINLFKNRSRDGGWTFSCIVLHRERIKETPFPPSDEKRTKSVHIYICSLVSFRYCERREREGKKKEKIHFEFSYDIRRAFPDRELGQNCAVKSGKYMRTNSAETTQRGPLLYRSI